MIRLVRAEWTKLFTTRVWIGLLLGACVMVAAFAIFFTSFAGNPEAGIPDVGTPVYEDIALSTAANANILFLILGIIGMTQEYRHRTATPTFLTTPRRGAVVAAKLVAYALAAAAFALVVVAKLLAYAAAAVLFALAVLAVTVAVVLVYAGARGAAPSFTSENTQVLLNAGLAIVVYAVIGVGLGALLRNQVGAIVGALVYLYVVEPLLSAFEATSAVYKWLPGGALEAMTTTFRGPQAIAPDLLERWQGGLL